jgi:DNA-binding winged helix-turn-helix (wHTH) protein
VAVEEGNVARHVSTLRKVLGDSADAESFIVTSRPGLPIRRAGSTVTAEPEIAGTAPRLSGARVNHRVRNGLVAAVVGIAVAAAAIFGLPTLRR